MRPGSLCAIVFAALAMAGIALAEERDPQTATAAIRIDGVLSEPSWQRAEVWRDISFPWSTRAAPATEFRAFADAGRLYFAFEVSDNDVVAEKDFVGESTIDREDRVEIFMARDAGLENYFCLEIDPLGRVHDYAASHYRKFDSSWACAGLQTAGRIRPGGYTVEASLPVKTLAELMGRPVAVGTTLRVGIFRAEFHQAARGDADDNWLSWIKPTTAKPDFHVPSAFADWRVPGREPASGPAFTTRGVVLVPEDLSLSDWPQRAAKAGLTTVALHHGASPRVVMDFLSSPAGSNFLSQCARLGLRVEYELHALRELLPRSLFANEPALFRMNDQGQRTPDANLCVHSPRALEIVTSNALRLARQLKPSTGRYFFWGDDGRPWCRCPQCRDLSDSDQALLLNNHLVVELRNLDPRAQLAHLAYANTLAPPKRVKPAPGVFLEFAPIHRQYDLPYAQQIGPTARDELKLLKENLRIFPVETAQVLEYWLDVSRFSRWKRPAVKLPWRRDVLEADARAYARLGIRHVTTFAVWIDAAYLKGFGEPSAIEEYGEILLAQAEAIRANDLSAWRSPTGEWQSVRDVHLDPANDNQFALLPGEGGLVNGAQGRTVDLLTKAEFGDAEVHVEFCISRHSNSGVYLMGRYEVQIYDSHGVSKDKYPGIECGGIYPRWTAQRGEYEGHSPRVNASKPAGEWQSFDILFRAPRFDAAGRKTSHARFDRVILNGQMVHENVELTGPTRAARWESETALAPLLLQGDHGPVAFRNVSIRPLLAR